MGLSRHEMEQFAVQKRIAAALELIAKHLDELAEHAQSVTVVMPTEKQIDELIAALDVGLQ